MPQRPQHRPETDQLGTESAARRLLLVALLRPVHALRIGTRYAVGVDVTDTRRAHAAAACAVAGLPAVEVDSAVPVVLQAILALRLLAERGRIWHRRVATRTRRVGGIDEAVVVEAVPAGAGLGRIERRRAAGLRREVALAIASLSRGRVVALVDLDLRAPSVAEALGIRHSRGIDDVLRGSCRLDDVRVEIERPGLDIYPARLPEANAHELLVGAAFAALVSELERRYEITVFDTPPMLLVPDGSVIIEQVGAAVAVSRAGRTRRKAFEKMLELLPPAKLIGTVLNEGVLPGSDRQYGYYGVPRPE